MLMLLAALVAVADPSSSTPQAKDADPIVCKRDQSSEVGTHMAPPKVCMKKSEWDIVEKHTQTELQSLRDRSSFDPGKADGHRPQ